MFELGTHLLGSNRPCKKGESVEGTLETKKKKRGRKPRIDFRAEKEARKKKNGKGIKMEHTSGAFNQGREILQPTREPRRPAFWGRKRKSTWNEGKKKKSHNAYYNSLENGKI